MATAFLKSIDSVTGNGDGSFTVGATVVFSGSDVSGGTDSSSISVSINGNDSPLTIRTTISDAIITEANRIGYTVVATDISLPYFEKGV